MLSNTMKMILSLSISGGVLALGLFALKPVIRNRLSKRFQYYVWLIVLLRLVLPLSLEWDIMSTLFTAVPKNAPAILVQNTSSTQQSSTTPINTVILQPQSTQQQEPPVYPEKNRVSVDVPLIIWGIAAVIFLAWHLVTYLRFAMLLSKSNMEPLPNEEELFRAMLPPSRVTLYRNPLAKTPLLLGIYKPKLIIPNREYSQIQLKNILLHELTHLRRGDVVIKWLATIVTAAHWFNPIIYFVRREMNNACELSCDEAVIRAMDKQDKQSYGDTLISVVAENRYSMGVFSTTMCSDKNELKERLVAIMDYKSNTKRALRSAALFVALTLCAAMLGAFTGEKLKIINNPTEYKKWEGRTITLDEIKELASKGEKLSFEDLKEFHGNEEAPALSKQTTLYSVEEEYRLIVEPSEDGNIKRVVLESIWEPEGKGIDIRTDNLATFLERTAYRPYTQSLLDTLLKYKTPYVGDNSKVANIASQLPVLDRRLKYDHIELQTTTEPYSITIFYVPINNEVSFTQDYFSPGGSQLFKRFTNNSLLLFSLIDNLTDVYIAVSLPKGTVSGLNKPTQYKFSSWRPTFEQYGSFDELWAEKGKILLQRLNKAPYSQGGVVINPNGKVLTLDDVKRLSKKGDELTMKDLEPYRSLDVGSGTYSLIFDLEEDFTFYVGALGLTAGKPTFANFSKKGSNNAVDIRSGDVEEFIKSVKK